MNFAVLVSGAGSTLEFLCSAIAERTLGAHICAVIADRPCAAVERAAIAGLKTQIFSRKALGKAGLDAVLAATLRRLEEQEACCLVVLAGYLSVLGPQTLDTPLARRGRIWNMHPSLLPKYGGLGMYGIHVHRAVLEAGEAHSGCTLHQVSREVDRGAILAQREVATEGCARAEELAARVQRLEKQLWLECLQNFSVSSAGQSE